MIPLDEKTLAECGARIEGGGVFAGDEQVVFKKGNRSQLGEGGFSIERGKGKAVIMGTSLAADAAALLELPAMQKEGRNRLVRKVRFTVRNYKHELNLVPGPGRSAVNYTGEFWSAVCRELVRRNFNGVVFYIGVNTPLEYLLDFKKFKDVPGVPAAERNEVRKAFNRILSVSRRYGLRTFMQEYVSHYTARVADKYDFVFNARNRSSSGRLANFYHPYLWKFFRYAHRRLFEVCPDLNGLYINYESSPTAVELMKEAVLPGMASLPEKPVVFHRLWDFVVPETLCDLAEMYPGETIVGHKIMDSIDAYNYPAADTRILEWKEAFARRGLDIPFVYLVGPCHNCGSNVSRRMWSDPEFIYTTLGKASKMGADGISFHTVFELTSDEFDSSSVISAEEREMARLNHFHLEAAVDFVRGGKFDEKRLIAEHAEHFGLSRKDAAKAYRALRDSSRAEIMHLLQFRLTSHEGYAVDARRQLAQHPFYFMHGSALNHQHREDPHLIWSYINKSRKTTPYPTDLQYVIDYVDPDKPTTRRNPAVMAREMDKLGQSSLKTARSLAKKIGPEFLARVESNAHLARTCARDIRVGIALFRLYFDKSKKQAQKHLNEAIAELEAMNREIEALGHPYVHMLESHNPAPDLQQLRKLRRYVKKDFPFGAFGAYARSKAMYNEIRRFLRPWRIWSDRTQKKAARLLRKAHSAAEEALAKCGKSRFGKNVRRWIDWLDCEIQWLRKPQMTCSSEPGEMQPMVHDNCFGYGGFAWHDFLSFFEPLPYDKGLDQSCGVFCDDRHFIIRAAEQGCDMDARIEHWKKFEGGFDPTGFIRIFIDTENDGKRLRNWCVLPCAANATSKEILCNGRQDIRALPDRTAEGWDAHFRHDASSWYMEFRIPFTQLGGRPEKGARWGFNVASNAPIKRNHAVSWCKGCEIGPGNPARMGTLLFE